LTCRIFQFLAEPFDEHDAYRKDCWGKTTEDLDSAGESSSTDEPGAET